MAPARSERYPDRPPRRRFASANDVPVPLGVDAVALLAWLRPRYRATEIAGGLTLTRWVTISQADGE
jgi:hypothetical protein